ncbi:MAG: DegT/DnrJ/EryC1/StrS family aminotransferase, partial [Bacteroidales bacterium]|nr:DegT/DnrJ/EryC1/StrS family aminotransferase [Bacteroidales bacterium]
MVDLQRQYRRIAAEIGSRWAGILETSSFIQGPDVQRFSTHLADYLSVRHAIPCGNGTDALQAAVMALELQPGDEVITTDFTFVAPAEVLALLRLTPVVVDVLPDTFNIDPAAVERAITPRTKAIVPVHLFGQCAPMAEILDIARRHGLHVIEDACQALGAEYRFPDGRRLKAGTMGEIGCTSFFPSKNLGCYGDGGALFTQDDRLAEKLRQVVNHGMKIRYHHDEIGCNSRLDTLQAAVLDVKLPHLDSYNEARRRAAGFYDRALTGCELLETPVRAP